jgi:ribonuclease inhibitor
VHQAFSRSALLSHRVAVANIVVASKRFRSKLSAAQQTVRADRPKASAFGSAQRCCAGSSTSPLADMNQAAELVIDVGGVQTREELHELISRVLNFPGYYGKNWDAFDECIRDFPPKANIRINGLRQLENTLPREAALMRQCFMTYEAEMPTRRKVYVS